jgi:hypothetical protein
MVETTASARKASSRTSTGRTNREEKIKIFLDATGSCRGSSGRGTSSTGSKMCQGGDNGSKMLSHADSLPEAPCDLRFSSREIVTPAELRERIGQSLKDDFDKYKLVHKLYDKIYRQTKNTRQTFRTFDPEGISGHRLCMIRRYEFLQVRRYVVSVRTHADVSSYLSEIVSS